MIHVFYEPTNASLHSVIISCRKRAKNVSLIERDETLDVFALFASHPFCQSAQGGAAGYNCLSFFC